MTKFWNAAEFQNFCHSDFAKDQFDVSKGGRQGYAGMDFSTFTLHLSMTVFTAKRKPGSAEGENSVKRATDTFHNIVPC